MAKAKFIRPSAHQLVDAEDLAVIDRLDDITDTVKRAASRLGAQEVRYLVDSYYQGQERRKASANQERSLREAEEPPIMADFLTGLDRFAETKLAQILQAYADESPPAVWAQTVVGIGPIISAGLAAHIDIAKAPTVGHIWRFAGLDPTQKWGGKKVAEALVKGHLKGRRPTKDDVGILADEMSGISSAVVLRVATSKPDGSPRRLTADSLTKALAMRPHNARLKTLTWKIGESFVKFKNKEADFNYGWFYDQRKEIEEARNNRKEFALLAEAKLKRVGRDTDAYKSYSKGKLPPAHIHARAKRYAVKLFLAHYHHVAYELHYGEPPPKPYVFQLPGHTHFIAPPNWPME